MTRNKQRDPHRRSERDARTPRGPGGPPRAHPPRSEADTEARRRDMIFGTHAVRAVLIARPKAVRRLAVIEGDTHHQIDLELAAKAGLKAELLDAETFQRAGHFTRDDRHQGIFVIVEPRTIYSEREFDLLENAHTILALDQISDTQNLAAMLRCAAFFGVDAILLLRDRAADVTPDVVRHAVGGAEFVKIFRVTNLSQSLDALKDYGFFVLGLDERGEKTLAQTQMPDKLVLVIGAEGDGLRLKTKKYCDALARIPGGRPGVESLNAGVAAAIAMAEVFRDGPRGG